MTKTAKDPVFSIMKGIAIISVVFGHANVGTITELVVNQYHLAVFFFVAGYCFNDKYLSNFKMYVGRRFKSLYLPFIEFGIFFIILHNVFYSIGLENLKYSFKDIIHELRNLTIGLTSEEPLMGAMWFCPALFLISLISYSGIKLSLCIRKKYNKFLFYLLPVVLIPFIGRLLTDAGIKSPRCLWQYMQVSGIYFVGYFFHKFEIWLYKEKLSRYLIYIAPVFVFLSVILFLLGFRAQLQAIEIVKENLFVALLIGSMSSIAIKFFSGLIKNHKVGNSLAYIGDNSFTIMALHFLCFKAVSFLYCSILMNYNGLLDFPTIKHGSIFWMFLYVAVGVYLPLFLSHIYCHCKVMILNSYGGHSNS